MIHLGAGAPPGSQACSTDSGCRLQRAQTLESKLLAVESRKPSSVPHGVL